MSDERLREKRLSSRRAFDGRLLKVDCDEVELSNGLRTTREVIRHPGAVMVVPMFDDNSVLLERQFRYALERVFIEFPAGKIDEGEDPLVTGKRELLEETGYAAREWSELATIHNAIGYADERIVLYVARGLEKREAALDDDEMLDVFRAPLADLVAWIADGKVTDVKTIIGALMVARRLGI
jgi:ADP-ribose pyrophosphatase